MKKAEKSNCTGFDLSTGKFLYANQYIIGISPLLSVLTEGCDGIFYDPREHEWNQDTKPLTKAECSEIAKYMISLWKQWEEKNGE